MTFGDHSGYRTSEQYLRCGPIDSARRAFNEIDRFSLAMDAIKRGPKPQKIGAHAKEKFQNEQIACRSYAFEQGIDKPDVGEWRWPY